MKTKRTFSAARVLKFYRRATGRRHGVRGRDYDEVAVVAEARQAYNEGRDSWELGSGGTLSGNPEVLRF